MIGKFFASLFRLQVFILAIFQLQACQKTQSSETEGFNGEKNPRVGVYVFDGTNVKASANTILYQFYQRAEAYRKAYFEGTDLLASSIAGTEYRSNEQLLQDTNNIIGQGVARICDDVKNHNLKYVYLAGYSRGAIQVLAVVARLQDKICGQKVTVRWVGLLDAVNTLVEGLPSAMPAASEIACLHVFKKQKFEHVLTTLDVPFCSSKEAVEGVNHQGLASYAPSLQSFISHATKYSRNTLRFADFPVPQLSDKALDNRTTRTNENSNNDVRDSSPTGKGAKDLGSPMSVGSDTNSDFPGDRQGSESTAQSCFAAESARQCLNMGCQWDTSSGVCQKMRR